MSEDAKRNTDNGGGGQQQFVGVILPVEQVADDQVAGGNVSEFLNDGHGGNSTRSVAESTQSEAIPIQRPERHSSVFLTDHNSLAAAVASPLSWPLAANQTLPGMEYLTQIPSQDLSVVADPLHTLSISWPLGSTADGLGNRSILQAMARRQEHLPQSYQQYRRPRTVSLSSTASEVLCDTVDDDRSPTGMLVMDPSFSEVQPGSENGPASVGRFLTVPDMNDPSHLTEDLGDASFHIDLHTPELYNSSEVAAEAIKPFQLPKEGTSATAVVTESFYATHTMPLQEPSISVIRQPPHQYRVRYDGETAGTPKGLLKDQEKESATIRLEHVPPQAGDIPIEISVRTFTGRLHPTIYATCFGKTMPEDWSHEKETGRVRTVVKAADHYTKQLNFLAVRRHKQETVDVTPYKPQELKSFRVKIDALVPSARGSKVSVSATTRLVQAVCPNKMTKLRQQQRDQRDRFQAPSAKKSKS